MPRHDDDPPEPLAMVRVTRLFMVRGTIAQVGQVVSIDAGVAAELIASDRAEWVGVAP